MAPGKIHIGIGGWTYPPWRGPFYPDGLPQKDELTYAGQKLTAIEINGTFYRTQKADSFIKWRDEVPEGFVFAVKGHRYAITRKDLREADEPIGRCTTGGVLELGAKLGPFLWSLPDYKQFDAAEFDAFLALMPAQSGGLRLRHAVELRHESFLMPQAVEIARKHNIAIVQAVDSDRPAITDITADFAYLRLQGTSESEAAGYSERDLDARAGLLGGIAGGAAPKNALAGPSETLPRDVYAFVVNGHKQANPLAAMALIERVSQTGPVP